MEKIYMIKYTLTRVPKNKLQKNIDKLLRVDDRFLLKESDFDKYKKSVDERIQKANETNRRCKPENNSLEIRSGTLYKRFYVYSEIFGNKTRNNNRSPSFKYLTI